MALIDKLNAIGNAVRSKTGGTELIPLDVMPNAIEGIKSNKLQGFLAYYKNSGGSDQWYSSLSAEDFDAGLCVRPYGFAGWLGDSISFPDGVVFTVYGGYQFYHCDSLKSVVLPSDLTSISEFMFAETSSLSRITLPSTITHIYQRAFHNSNLSTITIPAACKQIDSFAFYGCDNLKSVTFEGTPQFIASNIFNGCTALKDIYVPWTEGEVADAPWTTTSGLDITVHYNSQGGNT